MHTSTELGLFSARILRFKMVSGVFAPLFVIVLSAVVDASPLASPAIALSGLTVLNNPAAFSLPNLTHFRSANAPKHIQLWAGTPVQPSSQRLASLMLSCTN